MFKVAFSPDVQPNTSVDTRAAREGAEAVRGVVPSDVALAVFFGMKSPRLTIDDSEIHRTFFLLQEEFLDRFPSLGLFVFAEPGKYPKPYSPVLERTLDGLRLFNFLSYRGDFESREVSGSDSSREPVLEKFTSNERLVLPKIVERFDQECGVREENR